ncbi:MFS transporter [Microbacterium sp. MPKO10]|uniref:MFS transporter n=1 Tax=Microbacterium sp. MPKO10 TaxID=2989818 RepID=UPI00223568E5|nr:MFS transporter [Microbacterium sp. MPKO10]MCW4459863.1 MHS family MFS transporter [Microbacterium sp. MPKO10]
MTTQNGRMTVQARRVVFSSFIGTTIEWYDYFLYGSAAALVFAPQFFPSFSNVAGILASLATFAVGFLARPLGGVIMAHFGDKRGRKASLVASMTIMGCATVGIGLLPSYEAIGALAPILLTLLRMLQGFGVGGEWGGAALMAVEHAPQGRRGLYGSASQMGVPAGLIIATLAFLGMSSITENSQFLAWGWRVPFLASVVLIVVALITRLKITESPFFVQAEKQSESRIQMPFMEVLRKHKRSVVIAAGSFIAVQALSYLFMVYTLSYGTDVLNVSRGTMLASVLVGSVVWLVLTPISAHLSDKYGRRKIYLVGSWMLLIWAFFFFVLLDTAQPVLIIVSVAVMAAGVAVAYAPQSALFAEMFPTRVRYTGASLSYQLGAVFGGGPAPFIAAWLHSLTGASWPVTIYLVVASILSLVSVLLFRETHRDDLAADASSSGSLRSTSTAGRGTPERM